MAINLCTCCCWGRQEVCLAEWYALLISHGSSQWGSCACSSRMFKLQDVQRAGDLCRKKLVAESCWLQLCGARNSFTCCPGGREYSERFTQAFCFCGPQEEAVETETFAEQCESMAGGKIKLWQRTGKKDFQVKPTSASYLTGYNRALCNNCGDLFALENHFGYFGSGKSTQYFSIMSAKLVDLLGSI